MVLLKKNDHLHGLELLTGKEVAEFLNVSTRWVRDHTFRREPRLPWLRLPNGKIRYRHSEIEAFVDQLPTSGHKSNASNLHLIN